LSGESKRIAVDGRPACLSQRITTSVLSPMMATGSPKTVTCTSPTGVARGVLENNEPNNPTLLICCHGLRHWLAFDVDLVGRDRAQTKLVAMQRDPLFVYHMVYAACVVVMPD
jgi:hypothetical protein